MIAQKLQEKAFVGTEIGRGRNHNQVEVRYDEYKLAAESQGEEGIVDRQHGYGGFLILQSPLLITVGIGEVIAFAEHLYAG